MSKKSFIINLYARFTLLSSVLMKVLWISYVVYLKNKIIILLRSSDYVT